MRYKDLFKDMLLVPLTVKVALQYHKTKLTLVQAATTKWNDFLDVDLMICSSLHMLY